ncbi:glycoside hydrolase family 95 protein [Rubrolithibacter danxiaensis]|uniref:glycoside hydrolase family 95 protein n=1 Tax=Rubrolithibacter danxiaensis TaxID=3390805 RepID=UPI003BF7DB0F
MTDFLLLFQFKKCLFFLLTLITVSAFAQNDLKLWYKEPAKVWTDAMPLGNGRLGAMVYGGVNEELIHLNEETLWSGGPANLNPNPEAPKYLAQIREALFRGDYAKGEELCKKMQGLYTESYMPLGNLIIKQHVAGKPVSYYRDLDISTAVSSTRFKIGDTEYTREVLVSAPDQVIVIRITADKKAKLNFDVVTNSLLRFTHQVTGKDELVMKGKAPSHADPNYVNDKPEPVQYEEAGSCRGMRYELRVKAKNKGGEVTTDTDRLHVRNATEVVLYVSAATSYNGFNKCPDKEGKDESAIAASYLNKAFRKSFEDIKKEHIKDYQKYFNRVTFSLNNNAGSSLSTLERLMRYADGASDPSLESLYFQYGRYLLISCSRPGGIPANLQGIWNPILRAPWSSNFTTNINLQMNYWPAEMLNLSEMHLPLMEFIKETAITGKETAQNFYKARGWAVHHNSDIWATSNPVGDLGKGSPTWANWTMGSPWLSQHLWEHYSFSGDKTFLKQTAYPLMKEAALFCLDWLVEDENGYLVTAPASSPENVFITENGEKGSISVATTMDMSIIWDLFTNLIEASEQLGTDAEFRKLLIEKRSKLYPLQVGRKGNLQEWYKDWEEAEPHHRHVSHLFGLHPGRQISPLTTPQFAAAARKTLELRGDEGTGWSIAWKINFWARLHDGNHAYKLLRNLLHLTGVEGTNYSGGGGSYTNLFCAHPPFQIDGNFGGISGMGEMMLQSQEGFIHLLPAIPDSWKDGKVTGMRARGGFEVDMEWKDNKLLAATIYSINGGACKVYYGDKLIGLQLKPGQSQKFDANMELIK